MKKRLLSMLMAVLMIVSLVPAVSAEADTTTVIDIKADAAAKQPGIKVTTVDYSTYTVEIKAFAKMADICEKHTPVTKELLTATCNQAGLTVTYCSACGKDLNKKVETQKLHHDCTFTVVEAPTCDVDGWGYAVCTKCGTPAAVDNNTDFKAYVEQGKTELDSTYTARVAEVQKQYQKSGHDYKDVTAAIVDDDNNVRAYAGKEATHLDMVATYTPGYQWTDGAYISQYANDFDNLLAAGKIVAVSGDKCVAGVACTKCNKVQIPGGVVANSNLNIAHAAYMTVVDPGTLPVYKEDGSYKDGKTATYYCSVCHKTFGGEVMSAVKWFNIVEPVDAQIGDVKIYEGETVYKLNAAGTAVGRIPTEQLHKAVAATCCDVGNTGDVIVYTASGVADEETGKVPAVWMLKENGKELEKLDHHFVAKADKDATCTEDGEHYVGMYVCDNVVDTVNGKPVYCSETKTDAVNNSANTTVPKGHVPVEVVLVEATCQHDGLNVLQCSVCGEYLTKAYATAAAGAIPESAVKTDKVKCTAADELANVVEATCTEAGYTGDKVCKWCGDVLVKGEATEALGHTEEAVEAVAATCTEAGLTAGTKCSVCGEVIVAQEEVPALGHTFDKGVCTVCGAEDPDYVAPVAPEFTDAKDIAPYAGDAVAWAVANGIVNGRDDGSFDPKANVTRAEVVTMLYRLAGEPEVDVADVEFVDAEDVPDFATKAVAWAAMNGVVEGYEDGTFKPMANITRAEFVQMLYKMGGSVKAEAVADFSDVVAGEWYVDAINWAVENEVTTGRDNGTFGVADNATREEAVTFLFRAFAE